MRKFIISLFSYKLLLILMPQDFEFKYCQRSTYFNTKKREKTLLSGWAYQVVVNVHKQTEPYKLNPPPYLHRHMYTHTRIQTPRGVWEKQFFASFISQPPEDHAIAREGFKKQPYWRSKIKFSSFLSKGV